MILVGTSPSKYAIDFLLWCCPVAAVAACWRAPRLQLAILLLMLALALLDVTLTLQTHDCCAANGGYDGAGEVSAFAPHQLLGWISIGAAIVGFLVSLRGVAENAAHAKRLQKS
jgi:hypothetical protein